MATYLPNKAEYKGMRGKPEQTYGKPDGGNRRQFGRLWAIVLRTLAVHVGAVVVASLVCAGREPRSTL